MSRHRKPATWRIGRTGRGTWAVFTVEVLKGKEFRHVVEQFLTFDETCRAFANGTRQQG